MTLIFPALLLLLFVACIGLLYTEGMWSNAITLINVVTAGLLATNFWEPLARLFERMLPSFTFFWDFLALWGIFALSVVVFRLVTRAVSRYQVRFKKIFDQLGSVGFAMLVGWAIVCFTTMTLHTAPLARNFLFGGFNPEKRMLFGLAPDRQWLGFVKFVSKGSFSRWSTREFDEGEEFLKEYADRRQQLQTNATARRSVRIPAAELKRR